MEYQTSLTQGQPDDEAVRLLQYYEALALENDPKGYCVCTSEGKDSRVLGHLFRRAGVKHFYQHSITGIDPPELIYFQRSNFQQYRDAGYLTYDVMYRKSMWQLMLEKKIPPLRTIRYCCAELKEKRSEHQGKAVVSFGVRKYESVKRARSRNELEIALPRQKNLIMPFDDGENRKIFELCYRDREKRVNPLAYWTDADISKEGETFEDLMGTILSRENILLAYRSIKGNGGSVTPGTDKTTIKDLGTLTPDELVKQVRFIVSGSVHGYRPKPVRRKDIPKPNGSTRPLGIPCMWDLSLIHI